MSRKDKKPLPIKTDKEVNSKNIVQNSAVATGLQNFLPFGLSETMSTILCGARMNEYITNQPKIAAEIWQKNWIAKAIIEIPVQDAFKETPKINTDLASEEEVEQMITMFESKIYPKLLQFFYNVRAFGTAFLIVIPKGFKNGKVATIDLTSKISDMEIINAKDIDLVVASPYEMYDMDAYKNYRMLTEGIHLNEECPYLYEGQKLHKSRVIKMITNEPPPPIRQHIYTNGGLSMLENVMSELERNEKMKQVALTFTREAKLDIISHKGYADMQAEGQGSNLENALRNKLQDKDYSSVIVLDGNTTSYQQKQLSLANLDGLIREYAGACFLATGIPEKRLGISSSNGLSDSDKTAEQNYNKTLTFIRNWGREVVLTLYKMVFLKELQFIPNDLKVEFESLDVLTETEKQALRNQNLDNLLKLSDKVEINAEDLIDLVNKLKIFDKDIDFKVQDKAKE